MSIFNGPEFRLMSSLKKVLFYSKNYKIRKERWESLKCVLCLVWCLAIYRMTGIFHPVLLRPWVLSGSLWYSIPFPKMVSIRPERERIRRNVDLAAAHEFRTLWTGRHTPQNESREEGTGGGSVPGPRNVAPPQGRLAQTFSTRSLRSVTLGKPCSVVFLHCTVSVIKSVNPC